MMQSIPFDKRWFPPGRRRLLWWPRALDLLRWRPLGISVLRGGIAPLTSATSAPKWWLSGGIAAANCVAAYQAKGAASLAASYINLANPGTGNLTLGVAPTWDAGTGWSFNGSSQYLISGFTPANQTHSVFVRFANANNANKVPFGMANGSPTVFCRIILNNLSFSNSGNVSGGTTPTSGTAGYAGNQGYLDGIAKGTALPAWGSSSPLAMYVGTYNNFGSPNAYFDGTIIAIAFYSVTITAPQITALATAMNAL